MSVTQTQANEGRIVQCIGAVIDIQFPRENMPRVYDALTLVEEGGSFAEKDLTFEVEQQLGDGVVRTIAMGSSDGLRRGIRVKNTGAPISVPVGPATLGRVMDVLGRPIDERGPVNADERRSVRSLSGGETFQASLAFALALSEHLASLAATAAARLDAEHFHARISQERVKQSDGI